MTGFTKRTNFKNGRFPLLLLLLLPLLLAGGADWRQFRGTDSRSVVPDGALPPMWDIAAPEAWAVENPRSWRVELPGRGPAGPIVVGDRVFVTASGGAHQDELQVICFDATSGQRR